MRCDRRGLSAKTFVLALLAWLLLIAAVLPALAQTTERPLGWMEDSHANRVPANYEVVLPDDRVNEIYISFTPESWAAEEADMIELYGARGGVSPGVGPGGMPDFAQLAVQLDRAESALRAAFAHFPDFNAIAAALDFKPDELFQALGQPPGMRPPANRETAGISFLAPGRNPDMERMQLAARNPIWAPVTVSFEGETWWQVGFRFKGNSTLSVGWASGKDALPFKLDFDEFEDDYPSLDNQRFYGFKQLSFSNNDFDPSLQREKVTADIFRQAGAPAPRTAYYAVFVDKGDGEGAHYWGLYTAIELPDDTLIETQFADDSGNMYKPGGRGASFARGSFDEVSFDKETNRSSDYSDILAVFDALHADTRLSDPAAWRAGLESAFDAEGFLRWLAANTLLQNFDTYGILPHNYYLYADEASGQLVWIPWDNNMALLPSIPMNASIRAMRQRAPNFGTALSLDLDINPERWPLIGFLMDDEQYRQRYLELVAEISSEIFTPARMIPIYERNFELLSAYIRPYEGDAVVADLRKATDDLLRHVEARASAAAEFLARN